MAEPADSAQTVLSDVSSLIKRVYRPGYIEAADRQTGSTINSIVRPSKTRKVGGDGLYVKMGTKRFGGVRASASSLAALPDPGSIDAKELQFRYAEGSAEAAASRTNDFTRFAGTARVSINELRKVHTGQNSPIDLAEELVKEMTEDYNQKLATYRVLDNTGQLALVNGDLIDGADEHYYNGSTYSASATEVRFQIDNGSIGAFYPGMEIFIDAGGGTDIRAIVDDVNPGDNSLGVTARSGGTLSNFGASASAFDNAIIYIGDAAGVYMNGPGAWFQRPATGDSFIGGVDRQSKDWRHLIPKATREGQSSTPITLAHFDDLAQVLQFTNDGTLTVDMFMDLAMLNQVRKVVGNEALTNVSAMQEGNRRFGTTGLFYQHPQFGEIQFKADSLAPPGTIWAMVQEDWEGLFVDDGQFSFIENEGGSMWYRPTETSSTVRSLYYQTDTIMLGAADVCLRGWRQGAILNVT